MVFLCTSENFHYVFREFECFVGLLCNTQFFSERFHAIFGEIILLLWEIKGCVAILSDIVRFYGILVNQSAFVLLL